MPIYDYRDGSHPAGFTGFRVSVSIGGKGHERTFPANQEKQARRVYEQLVAQQKRAQIEARKFSRPPKPSVDEPTATGVPGIRIAIKPPYGRAVSYCAQLVVSTTNQNGNRIALRRRVSKATIEAAWDELTLKLAKAKGFKQRPRAWKELCPTSKHFARLARSMRKEGHTLEGYKF